VDQVDRVGVVEPVAVGLPPGSEQTLVLVVAQRSPARSRQRGQLAYLEYFTVDPGQDVVAVARCTRRGRQINYADITVRSEAGRGPNPDLTRGVVTVSVSGKRELDSP
jgi:acyl-coenzyme A thioesterase PaaI-like protein